MASLPPFLGGKRKLARTILRVVAEEGVGPGATLADAFSGGCAVSIGAKALGYRVLANDTSPASEAIGKALVENSHRQLTEEDMALALTTEAAPSILPPEKELSLPGNCRDVLSSLTVYERTLEGQRRWLVRAWTTKLALSMSYWGVPTMGAGRRRWDDLTVGQVQQLLRIGEPTALAQRVVESLNLGVFSNGQENLMHRGDAVEFIREVGEVADAVYLDPPYPGVLDYETVYAGVNHLLEPDAPTEASEWSAEDGWRLLADTFDAAAEIPLWIVSMGTGADPEAIKGMMEERGRQASWRAIDHKHIQSLKKPSATGDELLVVGR